MYPAKIGSINSDGTYFLNYLDGDFEERARREHMKVIGN